MPYIYKYVNCKTQDVEYVGIINKDSNFPRRFDQHKRDAWYEPFKYDIYYAQVQSQTDAEALEGHFISFYGSDKYHNKAKTGWGECSFAPEIEWKKFDDAKGPNTHIDEYRDYLWRKAKSIQLQMLESQKELDRLTDQILLVNKEDKKLSRRSIRKWFKSQLYISYPPYPRKYAEKDDLFSMYCEFAENDPEMIQFEDADDFWDVMTDMDEYQHCIQGDTMYNLIEKEEYGKMICDDACEKLEAMYGGEKCR